MRPAFVTGGSSGIGLAAALELAEKGHDLALFARDAKNLQAASSALLQRNPKVAVETFAVDVANHAAVQEAVQEAIRRLGAPEMAIASAGMAQPGKFVDQPVALHERHMAVNYFGSLYFIQALIGPMAAAGGGHFGLIASGAAYFGIYGYGAYAPSKFALRGLAEILHLELAHKDISVTLIYPPDTDTPQLVEEKRTKPAATQKITEGGGLWSPEDIAARLISGMQAGRPVVAPGFQMMALNTLTSLIAPLLRWHQKRIVAKYDSQ